MSIAVIAPPANAPPANAPPADASPAVSTAPPILIGNPNASGVVCHNRNGMKHSNMFEACNSINATNYRAAPNLLQNQFIVNESFALNFISKITNSSDFKKNNDSVLTTFQVIKIKIIKSNDDIVDGNATSFQPIGLNEKVVKSFGSYKSVGLKLNYSCECVVHELNDTYCGVVQKIVTPCFANGKACEVVDDAAVQSIASNDTLVPGNVSGAAAGVNIDAEIRESDVLTILVGISCCLSIYFSLLICNLIATSLGI